MVLREFLKKYKRQPMEILRQTDYTEEQIDNWSVIHYPDELLYVLSKELEEEISVILYHLFYIENPGYIRRVASDYALRSAFQSEAAYIFIPQAFRKTQSQLLTEVSVDLNFFELDLGPLAKYNIIGKKIYEVFLAGIGKSDDYYKIEDNLDHYYVLVHDDGGSILVCEK